MGDCEIAARIQESVGRLTHKDRSSEKRLEVRGACAVFYKKVYHNGNLPLHLDKLDLKPLPEVEDRVKTTLNKWAAGEKLVSLMSEDLLVHLNLPVGVCPRNCWLFQAIVLGKNLPFILLTLYDGDSVDSTPDRHEIADFAMGCARMLTSQLLSYCRKDFILLPSTLKYQSFDVQGLREEVKIQKCRAAEFYGGPTLLRKESYEQICTALSILAIASDVPYFFEESPDAGKKLLVGDPEGDSVLRQIISYLRTSGAASSQTLTITYTETTSAVKMILLEAAKRLSYFQRVIVITENAQVQKCVEKLAKNAKKEFGLDPSCFQSISPQEAKLSKHTTGKDRRALSSDADRTDRRTGSSQLADRRHEEPATHQKETIATVTSIEANFTTATTKENISEKLAPNKETYPVSGLNEAVKSDESTPISTVPSTEATAATETDAQEDKDSAGRNPKNNTEKPRDLIEPSSNDMASDEPTYNADGTAAEKKSADHPTGKKRKVAEKKSADHPTGKKRKVAEKKSADHPTGKKRKVAEKKSADHPTGKKRKSNGNALSKMGLREGNSDVKMNLGTSTKRGKVVGMDGYPPVPCVIAIDTPECPTDCCLLLHPTLRQQPLREKILRISSFSGDASWGNQAVGKVPQQTLSKVMGQTDFPVSFSPVTRGSKRDERGYGDVILEVVETPGVFGLSESFPD